jgi:ATPase subunit of ABC transporter with duplicated ATPase domains
MLSHDKLLDKLKHNNNYALIIVGRNGSGKTTLMNKIEKLYSLEKIKKYSINENRQFSQPDIMNPKEYKLGFLSHMVSTGESLFSELNEDLDKDINLFDEPTATLDFYNTSFIIEGFIRKPAKIKVMTSNDYVTLLLLSGYIPEAYNVEIGKMINIKEYLNNMINETTKKIKKDKLFLEVNFESYKYLNL